MRYADFPYLLAAALLAGAATLASPARAAEPSTTCQTDTAAPAPKKKGFGLGGLLGAAKRAGVGDMLTGRAGQLLGSGKGGAVAGAVAGTALAAADGSEADTGSVASAVTGLAGSGRTAQIAGAVTGTAMEAVRASTPAACTAG